MLSRRQFLQASGAAGRPLGVSRRQPHARPCRGCGRPEPHSGHRRGQRGLLARSPAGVHARPHHRQSQQRGLLSEPAGRARGVQAYLISRTRRPSITCGRSSSRTSRPCAAGSRPNSAATPRSWRSRATPARPCRSAQLGIDLQPGDEVVTTNQDYGRMLDTWEQRVRRDGIKLSKISFPVPPRSHDELADRCSGRSHRRRRSSTSATSRTSPADLSGQAHLRRSPASRREDHRRRRARIRTLSARSSDLGCDFYGTSLHKWLLARSERVPLRPA